MRKVMRTSGAETLAAAANVFMGQTEAPLLIKPYIPRMTTSEMTTADTSLWQTPKSRYRLDLDLDAEPVAVQIAGSEPAQLAAAARACVDRGAQIIDINMGCPAKKVTSASGAGASGTTTVDQEVRAQISENSDVEASASVTVTATDDLTSTPVSLYRKDATRTS